MEAKIRYLEMIQSAMTGASNNSLRIKGFTMLLLAGTIALLLRNGADTADTIVIPFHLAIIIILVVGFLFLLDFYFIRQSDLFNVLYDRVRVLSEGDIDFSMEVEQYGAELDERYREFPSFPLIVSGILHLCLAVLVVVGTLPSIFQA